MAWTLGPLAQGARDPGEARGRRVLELESSCTQQHLTIVKHLVGGRGMPAPEMPVNTDNESVT